MTNYYAGDWDPQDSIQPLRDGTWLMPGHTVRQRLGQERPARNRAQSRKGSPYGRLVSRPGQAGSKQAGRRQQGLRDLRCVCLADHSEVSVCVCVGHCCRLLLVASSFSCALARLLAVSTLALLGWFFPLLPLLPLVDRSTARPPPLHRLPNVATCYAWIG